MPPLLFFGVIIGIEVGDLIMLVRKSKKLMLKPASLELLELANIFD